jgi:hypothetical protein
MTQPFTLDAFANVNGNNACVVSTVPLKDRLYKINRLVITHGLILHLRLNW